MKFGYIPQEEFLINSGPQAAGTSATTRKVRGESPDFAIVGCNPKVDIEGVSDRDEEHVLVLDFISKSYGKKSENPA